MNDGGSSTGMNSGTSTSDADLQTSIPASRRTHDMTDTMTPTPPAASAPSSAGTGIRVATAVIGGSIAVIAIVAAAVGQFGLAGAMSSETSELIPASITSIEIDNTVGDVSVFTTPGATPKVDMMVDAFAWNQPVAPQVTIDGTELSIDVPDRGGICFGWCSGQVTILIELGDLSLDELDITSDVGTIAVNEGVVVRDLSVESSVGDIRADLVQATAIDITSDVGNVQVWADAQTRSIIVTTSVGDIEIGVQPGVEYDARASSEIGSVTTDLTESRSATNTITASSEVGDVTLFTIR